MNDHRVWTVYRYYDAAGRLLYIGVTGQGHWRTHQHRRAAPWWPSVVRAEFEHFTDGVAAFEHETALIARLAPLHNGEQLGRTAREITAELTDAGMDVSERYVARILDAWTADRRGSGARRKGGR
jgi:hypothetical protein